VIITAGIRSIPASGRARSSGSPFFVHLLDEVEYTITWADDDADEAGDSGECHETEGRTMIAKLSSASHRSVRCGRKHKQGLDGILELHEQSEVDTNEEIAERRRDS